MDPNQDATMFEADCPHCGDRQMIDAEHRGLVVFCQSCGQRFQTLAGPAPSYADAPSPAPAGSAKGDASGANSAAGGFYWEGRPAHREMLGQWILGILLAVVLIGFYFIIRCILWRLSRHYTITPDHIITREGLVSINTMQIAVKDIRSIEIRASVRERLLGIRSVEIATAGTEGVDMTLLGIPVAVAEAIQQLQRK